MCRAISEALRRGEYSIQDCRFLLKLRGQRCTPITAKDEFGQEVDIENKRQEMLGIKRAKLALNCIYWILFYSIIHIN